MAIGKLSASRWAPWFTAMQQASCRALEVNYGALPDVQLHVKVSVAFNSQSVTGTQFGYGDTEIGVKYRFINPGEDDWWPQVAAYPAGDRTDR